METPNEANPKVEALYVESVEAFSTETAHVVDKDSWRQVGLMLATSFNCAYIFSYSNLIMVPLGWSGGLACLVAMAVCSFYSSWVIAGLHVIDGRRFIRYRDIMGHVFGRKMYYLTYTLQFLTLILGNMGFILLGAKALKEINEEFSTSVERLQVFIVINGVVYFMFSSLVPNLSAMRIWLGYSAAITIVYVAATLSILIKDGKANKLKDYGVPGTSMVKFMNVFGAIAATAVANNGGLIPEIQSTLRKPVVENMRRALWMQFTLGLMGYYGMAIAGYWAYGSRASEYLPRELSGPKWTRILINSLTFLQSIVSQHMFIAPVHEALDTKFLNLGEPMHSKSNVTHRVLLRAAALAMNTLITAALPFMGDFVNLLGSLGLLPLTFLFPSMIVIKVKGKSTNRAWHWAIIVLFLALTVLSTIAAVRLIVHDTKTYHFFANT